PPTVNHTPCLPNKGVEESSLRPPVPQRSPTPACFQRRSARCSNSRNSARGLLPATWSRLPSSLTPPTSPTPTPCFLRYRSVNRNLSLSLHIAVVPASTCFGQS